jgi:2-phosphoglycerate kinase
VRHPTVFLIGGAPGAGKTTLGRALAYRLDATSLTADDLLTAAKAVTTPRSHPGLHIMAAVNSIEYFTTSSVDQLAADATVQHEAIWPAIEEVIRRRAASGPPIVIDGWFLQPKKVAELNLDGVISFWLVADPAVLQERERRNVGFFGRSANPEQMLQNFLERSFWYNDLIRRQATELGLHILHQDGHASVDALCAMAMKHVERDG